jgi:hypothetical protein
MIANAAHVDVDDGALALASPELAEVLTRLTEATQALGTLFATLAADPTRYEAAREDLARLTRERRAALERTGQLASRVFVVRTAAEAGRVEATVPEPDEPPDSRILPVAHAAIVEEESVAALAPPSDWPYFKWTRGKTVVMIGGAVREERRLELEEAFACSTLTWIPHDRPRLLQALVERAGQGRIDVILVNELVGLDEMAALSRASSAPVIHVRLGYDVLDVKTALEQHFAKR